MGFPGIGMPTIIIRKNLKNKNGSPIINPINLFRELDDIFESLFDNLAETMITGDKEKLNKNNDIKYNDQNDLEDIDLSLNETESNNHRDKKHIDHEQHIKLNYVKDLEKDKQENTNSENDLKIEEINKYEDIKTDGIIKK